MALSKFDVPMTDTVEVALRYRILSSKRPWALEIHRPKNGGGTYTEKLYV